MNCQPVDCILTGESGPSAHVCPVDIPLVAPVPRNRQKQSPQKQRYIKCHVFGCKSNLVKAYDKVSTSITTIFVARELLGPPNGGSFKFVVQHVNNAQRA